MSRPQAPTIPIRRYQAGAWERLEDSLAAEEPLQLLLDGRPLSIVMRTPGNDLELALGLLYAERVIRSLDDVVSVRISAETEQASERLPVEADLLESNRVDVHVREGGRRPERSFVQSSACGVCGATTVDALALDFPAVGQGPDVDPGLLPRLPGLLREGQALFSRTGGLHAAAVFAPEGTLRVLREDVGRHNAVDKVNGRLLLDGRLPARDSILAVSGRAGYEIVQKALAAGIPVVVAVGAPSSLAAATAGRFGITLAGFARDARYNVYSAPERLDRTRRPRPG
jgi:FdhD protein